jgi:hypothetical protein
VASAHMRSVAAVGAHASQRARFVASAIIARATE